MKRGKWIGSAAVALGLLSFGSPMRVRAASVTIINPSFEVPGLTAGQWTPDNSGGVGNSAVTGWTFSGSDGGVWYPSATNNIGWVGGVNPFNDVGGWDQIKGLQVAYSNGSTISQTLTATLQANTMYTLSLEVGDRLDVTNTGTTFSYGLYDVTTHTLLAGATNVTETQDFASSKGDFINLTASFTNGSVGAGDTLAIELSASSVQYDFDNVSLDATAVPLPSAAGMGLGVLGLIGAAGLLRKKLRTA